MMMKASVLSKVLLALTVLLTTHSNNKNENSKSILLVHARLAQNENDDSLVGDETDSKMDDDDANLPPPLMGTCDDYTLDLCQLDFQADGECELEVYGDEALCGTGTDCFGTYVSWFCCCFIYLLYSLCDCGPIVP